MSHQVLARKWRPQSFAELAGQQHVLQALGNSLEQQRIHHAYLLTGTRGVGKTTIARILARCLNCETGISENPCGECTSCREISEGRCLDLIEVDAASRTKVEDTRELLENVQFAPSSARYKIYLIDEVHMLSNSSFNALLKTLEEPPPHAVFILATTHPQKIPPTVLSRCLQFHLKNLPAQVVVDHANYILEAEGISAETAALQVIAHAAAGSMRDALSLIEQAISFGSGSVLLEQVNDMLGVVDHQVLLDLTNAIIDGDGRAALAQLATYAQRVTDFTRLIDDLLALYHRVAVEQVVPGAGAEAQLLGETIADYATRISPEDIQLFYQILLNAKRDMALAPDPLTGMEMLLLRLLAFRPVDGDTVLADPARVATESKPLSRQVEQEPSESTQGPNAVRQSPVEKTERVDATKKPAAVSDRAEASTRLSVDMAQHNSSPSESAGVSEQAEDLSGHNELAAAPFDPASLNPVSWCEIFSRLPLSGVVRAIAGHCVPLNAVLGASCHVEFALQDSDALLYKEEHSERLATSLSIFCGCSVKVSVRIVEDWVACGLTADIETPAMYKQRLLDERQEQAIVAVQQDENIQTLLEAFDGEVDMESVVPVSTEPEGDQPGS
ncbi:MAG: DNA polymerase III subunit gamma/tau [Pseudomonadales bacterium]|nr:DNA polymerase III subunit gamma/tau [Pseudomonadales bacterium]